MPATTKLTARLRAEGTPLVPAGVTIAVITAWAATGGGYESAPTLGAGYEPDPWYLGGLMIVGLLCATAVAVGKVNLARWTKVACAAFGLYVVWSFLSVTWAHDQGAAFLGSGRALVYFAAFLTFAILPWRDWSVKVALGMLVAALGALALITAIRVAALANPAALFLNARLSYPLGYYNADAAMFMVTAITAVALCSGRWVQPALRVAGITLAALCLQLAVLGQSRGWLFTAPIILLLALLLVPNRLRLLVFALGPAIATAAIAPTLLHVYGRATTGGVALAEPRLGEILHRQSTHAVHAMLIADAALVFVLTLAVIVDRRMSLNQTAQARLRRVGSAAALVAVLAAIAGGLAATHGHPLARVERAWSSFANTNNTANESSRFTTLGSQRVDFWRVALHEFSRHPLAGIGQDNFAAPYLRERHTDQEPRWTHSIELRLLTHTGLVGALLFALFLLAVLLASRAKPRKPHAERVSAAIALLPLVVWLVHGSVDWLWEFPALSVTALSFAGAATSIGSAPRPQAPEGRPRQQATTSSPRHSPRLAVGARVGATLLGAGALAALAIP
ncbi:MAG: O-antigen ligase family protein, partial [Solirubrobacteraceae bacterium]